MPIAVLLYCFTLWKCTLKFCSCLNVKLNESPPPQKKGLKNVNLQTVVHDVHPDLSSYKFLLVYCIGIH